MALGHEDAITAYITHRGTLKVRDGPPPAQTPAGEVYWWGQHPTVRNMTFKTPMVMPAFQRKRIHKVRWRYCYCYVSSTRSPARHPSPTTADLRRVAPRVRGDGGRVRHELGLEPLRAARDGRRASAPGPNAHHRARREEDHPSGGRVVLHGRRHEQRRAVDVGAVPVQQLAEEVRRHVVQRVRERGRYCCCCRCCCCC